MLERRSLRTLDLRIAATMWRFGLPLLRLSLALVFVWFGGLKILGHSPAADLIARTAYFLDPAVVVPLIGAVEVMIGLTLLWRPAIRVALLLILLLMPGFLLPLLLVPDVTFRQVPWALTLEGQYIIKDAILLGAALVVGGTVRGPGRDAFLHRKESPDLVD